MRSTRQLTLTADYQFITNPAYNADRGPVHVFSGRFHGEFVTCQHFGTRSADERSDIRGLASG